MRPLPTRSARSAEDFSPRSGGAAKSEVIGAVSTDLPTICTRKHGL